MSVETGSGPKPAEILVVEDSITQAEHLRYMLQKHGFDAVVAPNGQEALKRMFQQRPSLVVTDIVMPEMDGFQLCRAIKDEPALMETPVILLTSLTDPDDVLRGLECGADNFITKPYDENYLISRIHYSIVNAKLGTNARVEVGVQVYFKGQTYFITSERQQILSLLLSTYETAVKKNQELAAARDELKRLNERLEEKVEERTAQLRQQIREREHSQESLRRSEEKFSKAFRASPDWMAITTLTEGHFVEVNEAFVRISGYSWEEVQGRTASEISLWADPKERPRIMGILETQGSVHGEEVRFRTRSGEIRTMLWSAEPIEVDGVRCAMAVASDITERKALEEQLFQSQKMEALGRLAGGVAHDLNNLMTVVTGYSQLLRQALPQEDPMREDLEEISKAGDRASGLVGQLLAFSRRQMLQPRILDLNEVVTDMEKMLRRVLGEDIDLETRPGSDLCRVKVDPGQMEQVIMNLAVNARDAMPKGGNLTIETANVLLDDAYARTHASVKPGPYVMLAVSDTGTGMDEGTRARIFEPFFTTKEKGQGTGLGLSTVYGIVKQSGGEIWVYSEPGQGATFKVYLPAEEEGEAPFQRKETGELPLHGTETVLVVEDSEEVMELVVKILAEKGYHAMAARDGGEALRICEAHAGSIQLMVTDVVMPGMSGRELAESLKGTRPEMKVLYMSGYTDNAIVHHGILDAGVDFLQKPFTPQALAQKVREVLDG
jgi:PAS domain S-box-containing protein